MAIPVNESGWPHHVFTANQVSKLLPRKTRPIYLIEWAFSGTVEYISVFEDITFDSQLYSSDFVGIKKIVNSKAAVLVIASPDTVRMGQAQNQNWRNGACKITYIPALETDGFSFNLNEGYTCIDGVIDKVTFPDNSIQIAIVDKHLTGTIVPQVTFNNVCNHLAPAGTVISWEGETEVLIETDSLVLGLGG